MRVYASRGRAKVLAAILLAGGALALAACGGSSDKGGSTTKSSGSSASSSTPAPAKTYTGRDSKLPNGYPAPTVKSGKRIKIGYLQIYGAIDVLRAEQTGAEAAAKQLGVQLIVKDAGLNLQTQVAQFNDLVAQKVDAIVVYPVVPESLIAAMKAAKAKGIPVIATNARPDVSKPLPPGYTSDVEQALDFQAWSLAQAMAKMKPGAKFSVIGLAIPVAALKFLTDRIAAYSQEAGMKFLGRVEVKEDTPAGYGAAMTALLAKYPDVEAVFTYSDILALSAQAVARSAGKTNILFAGGQGGTAPMHKAIKAGRIALTYQDPWHETGAMMVRGAYLAVTKQHLPLPETVTLKGQIITKDNVDKVPPAT
jgi:ribose transport system substrate-binding protein